MSKPTCSGRAMPGAGAFHALAALLCAHAVPFNEETMSQRLARDSRAADLRDALRALGRASASELADVSGIASKRIGGILSHDVMAGRVLAQRDPRAPNRTLVYELAPRGDGGRT